MTVEERIAAAAERMRLIWSLFMVASVIVAIIWLPFWMLLFLIPYAVVTYFAALTVTGVYLSSIIDREEVNVKEARQQLLALQERLSDGPVSPEEMRTLLDKAGLSQISPVEAASEEIGKLNGRPIFEWVELYDPHTKAMERFMYYGPAPEGELPKVKGKVFANVDGVLYVRDSDAT